METYVIRLQRYATAGFVVSALILLDTATSSFFSALALSGSLSLAGWSVAGVAVGALRLFLP